MRPRHYLDHIAADHHIAGRIEDGNDPGLVIGGMNTGCWRQRSSSGAGKTGSCGAPTISAFRASGIEKFSADRDRQSRRHRSRRSDRDGERRRERFANRHCRRGSFRADGQARRALACPIALEERCCVRTCFPSTSFSMTTIAKASFRRCCSSDRRVLSNWSGLRKVGIVTTVLNRSRSDGSPSYAMLTSMSSYGPFGGKVRLVSCKGIPDGLSWTCSCPAYCNIAALRSISAFEN